jgi:hypothetical protein
LDYHVFGSQKEALHVDEDLPVLMKFRVWCKCGYDHSSTLQITSEGVWIAVQYAVRKEVSQIVVREVINKFTLHFDFALYFPIQDLKPRLSSEV